MKLKSVPASSLNDPHQRACARLARIAVCDTIFGGTRALRIAARCKYKKIPAEEIIGDVYSSSNGSAGEWGAYECPECGQVYLGTEAAYACCAENFADEENDSDRVLD